MYTYTGIPIKCWPHHLWREKNFNEYGAFMNRKVLSYLSIILNKHS